MLDAEDATGELASFAPAPFAPDEFLFLDGELLSELLVVGDECADIDEVLAIKRTFQPSLVRRKRKHGFLSRLRDRHGRKVSPRRVSRFRYELQSCVRDFFSRR